MAMSILGKLRRLLAVRVSDTPGVGSGSLLPDGPPTSLHEPRPTTTSAPVRPDPAEPDPEE
jgi:hypothetical protein